jgi:hypothetical protein
MINSVNLIQHHNTPHFRAQHPKFATKLLVFHTSFVTVLFRLPHYWSVCFKTKYRIMSVYRPEWLSRYRGSKSWKIRELNRSGQGIFRAVQTGSAASQSPADHASCSSVVLHIGWSFTFAFPLCLHRHVMGRLLPFTMKEST